MTPLHIFLAVWARCDELRALHSYLSANLTGILKPDELLRAEWVARVSALDLYVHELVAHRMVDIFLGTRPASPGYRRFQISNDVMQRIRNSNSIIQASLAFDLEIRTWAGYQTYQDPEKIADAVRLFSDKELWNEIALTRGSTPTTKSKDAKTIKKTLAAIIDRRNKIAHEGDLDSSVPRTPYPISSSDLDQVTQFIKDLVNSLETVTA